MKTILIKFLNGEIIPVDKMLHFFVQFTILTIFSLIIGKLIPLIIINFIVAIIKELFDKYVKKTQFDIKDMVYGLSGGFLSIFLILYI